MSKDNKDNKDNKNNKDNKDNNNTYIVITNDGISLEVDCEGFTFHNYTGTCNFFSEGSCIIATFRIDNLIGVFLKEVLEQRGGRNISTVYIKNDLIGLEVPLKIKEFEVRDLEEPYLKFYEYKREVVGSVDEVVACFKYNDVSYIDIGNNVRKTKKPLFITLSDTKSKPPSYNFVKLLK